MDNNSEGDVALTVKWTKYVYTINLPIDSTVLDLKMKLQDETSVLTKKQKLMGLKANGKQATDECFLKDIELISSKPILMIGTVESSLLKFDSANIDVIDDFDDDDADLDLDPKDREENHMKIANRVKNVCLIDLPHSLCPLPLTGIH